VGFWKALHDIRLGELVASPEFLAALALGGGGSIWLVRRTTVLDRVDVVGDYLFVVGPLVGVVIAGLALVITLLSASYLKTLRGDKPLGIVPFMQPFILVIGIQTVTVVACVAYRAAALEPRERIEQVAFCSLSFLFVLSCFEVVAIARNLIGHSAEADVEESEDKNRVSSLHDRRR
jgi:hypothetical protein